MVKLIVDCNCAHSVMFPDSDAIHMWQLKLPFKEKAICEHDPGMLTSSLGLSSL